MNPEKNKEKTINKNDEWDRKKIIITGFFLIVAVLVAFELKSLFLPKSEGVLGESAQNKTEEIKKPDVKAPNLNISTQVGAKIEEIKKNISGLDAVEVASSSPQIQKVLHDMEQIRNLPANQAKDTCLKICSGI